MVAFFANYPFNLMLAFPWEPNTFPNSWLEALTHQIRPGYLLFYSLLNFVIASLVFPLEQAIGWKKIPFTKFLIICGILEWTLFIPSLTYTNYAFIPIVVGFAGIILGIFLNIGVNIKLFIQTPGSIRTRSFYAIIAFFCMALGLVLSLQVGWLKFIGVDYAGETIIGSIIQVFAAIFYRKGFGFVQEMDSNNK